MPIHASCACGKRFQARDSLSGKQVRCPSCGGVIQIPQLAAPASDDPLGLGDLGNYGESDFGRPPMSSPMSSPMPAPTANRRRGAARAPAKSNLVLWLCLSGGGVLAALAVGVVLVFLFSATPDGAVADSTSPSETSLTPATDHGGVAANSVADATRTTDPQSPIDPATSQPTWSVRKDPPSSPVHWPDRVAIEIPVPAHSYYTRYPATPSPCVAIGLNSTGKPGIQIWDVVKNEKVGEINEAVPGTEFAVSPDGQFLAAYITTYGKKFPVYSAKTGQKVIDIEYGSDHLTYFAFNTATTLVTHSWGSAPGGYEYAIRVWSIPDGAKQQEIQLKKSFQKGKIALSAGGRYLAAIDGGDKLSLLDLKAGTRVGFQELEQLVGEKLGSCFGLSFSPDGKQLGVVYASTHSRVIFLDTDTGKVAESLTFAGKPPTASAYTGDAIEWLGDRGWCLFGGTVIDRKTKRLVWNLTVPTGEWTTPRRTLPGGWIVQAGPYAKKRLQFLPLPTAEIDASLAALESKAAAALQPGGAVSLEIAVGNLRAGTPEDTKQRLAELFTERFQGDKIAVAPGQPLVLKVDYSETEGGVLAERRGIAGPATGRTVQSTKVMLQMSLASTDGTRAIFSDKIEYDPRLVTVVGKELNESSVRDSIFNHLLYRVTAAPIPYFVPEQAGTSPLPGTTSYPD